MLGAIVGDIVGSIYEFHNHRSKEFPLFGRRCSATDDSIMTLAVAKAICETPQGDYGKLSENAVKCMHEVGRPYPRCGYGGQFRIWMYSDDPKPYNSFGNGAAMRVSPCGMAAQSIEAAKKLSYAVTAVTHNHPEGIKGAEATAVAVYLAKAGKSLDEIRAYITSEYYPIDFTLDEIRKTYHFNETCQQTVPQAMEAFFESTGFEDAIRNAISIGGDSDTLAAITGAVAGAYYGVPEAIAAQAATYLDSRLKGCLEEFERKFPTHPAR
jgi:type I restriction enzyme M protein